jgi:hypothetical protein
VTIRCRISDSSGVEIALALAAAVMIVALALARRRTVRRRVPVGELGDQAADDDIRRRHAYQQALDLEEGALDPDELGGDPSVWDEGADDEVR